MKPDLRPVTRDVAGEVRAAAQRQARQLSGGLLALVGMGVAAFVMIAFLVLDYGLDQDPHRIFKIALGLGALAGILMFPRFGLLLVPIVTPFLGWVPPTPVPGLNLLNVLLFSIFGTFAMGRILARAPLLRPTRLGPVIGWLFLVAALSIVRGGVWPTGLGYDTRLASLALFRSATTFTTYFIVLAMARGLADRRRITLAVLLGLLAEAVVTIALGRNGSGGRATGSLGQANELGAFLALFSVVALALVPAVRAWAGKLALLALWGLGSFAILLTLSRGSMLALLGGSFLVAWRGSKVLFGVLLAGMLLSPFWMPDYVRERISQSAVQGEDEGISVDMAAEKRLETWQTIFHVVADHPLEGVGFTGLGYVLPDLGAELGLADIKDSAHNTYLRMLSELGIFGLGIFVWLLWSCLRLANAAVRGARCAFDRGLAIGLSGSVVSIAISCAFGDRFFSVVLASSLWILCAVVEDSLWRAPGEVAA